MADYITMQDDRLDRICQRHYGACRGVVEQVLEANPRLADRGCVLAAGMRITLPDIRTRNERPQVRLWD
jgi:phage tail protein X